MMSWTVPAQIATMAKDDFEYRALIIESVEKRNKKHYIKSVGNLRKEYI